MSRVSGSSYASKLMGRASTGDGSTLSLDFTAMGGVLDPLITFSRADATARATFINSSGFVQTVATAQAPRFTFSETSIGTPRGLLLEAPATNVTINGQYSFGGNWGTSGGINVNAVNGTAGTPIARIDGPDNGTLTGTSITKDAGFTFVRLFTNTTVSSSTQYTYSLYVRAGTGGENFFRLATFNGGSWLDTVGGCSDPTVTITNSSGNGSKFANLPTTRWVRVWVVFTTGAGQTSTAQAIYPNTDTSAATINYIWGAQIELGSAPSSVILTGATSVTRAVDTAIIAAGTNFSSWYTGGTTGTFVTEWCRCSPTTTQRTVIATSDVSNQHLHQYIAATTSRLRLADKVPAFIETANASVDNSINKGAFSYAGSVQSLCLNGGTVVPGTLTFTTAPTWLSIGGPSTNGTSITDTAVVLNNAIRKIKYFPTRLSDGQIQGLTTL
jgi:hypothetical protein